MVHCLRVNGFRPSNRVIDLSHINHDRSRRSWKSCLQKEYQNLLDESAIQPSQKFLIFKTVARLLNQLTTWRNPSTIRDKRQKNWGKEANKGQTDKNKTRKQKFFPLLDGF